MEENEVQIERNLIASIGSNEEITEPHVKQIISAFGGKKFAREDIDKFKQLETSFRNIAKLKDGEDILKNLTTDIKETIINSARYQASDGTISIGQIASVIIARSEEVYKENLVRNETIETKSVMAETIKKIDEEKEKNGGKLWVAEHGLKEEEIKKFEGDLFALFRGLGIEMTKDDEKDHSEFSDDMHKRAENPEDVIAREYVEREKEFFEKRDKESGLRYADAMIRALKELIEGKLKLIDNPMLSKELREAAQKELDKLEPRLAKVEQFRAAIEKGEAAQMLGAAEENIEEFKTVEDRMKAIEATGNTDTKEYEDLQNKMNFLLKAPELAEIENKIENLNLAYKEMLAHSETENSDVSQSKIDDIKKEIIVLKSQRDKILGIVDDKARFEVEEYKDENIIQTVQEKVQRKDNSERLELAAKQTRELNDRYLNNNGEIGFLENHAAYYGTKANLFEEKEDDQEAIEIIANEYASKIKLQYSRMKLSNSEIARATAFRRIAFLKERMKIDLKTLNISKDYLNGIVDRITLEATNLDPIEYQKESWKSAIYTSKKKHKSPEELAKLEEALERLEKNQDVYNDISEAIKGNRANKAAYTKILEAIDKSVHGKVHIFNDLKRASSNEEVMALLQKGFDAEYENKPEYSLDIRKRYLDIMKQVLDKRGKDGIITICESGIATRMAFNEIKADIHREHILDKYKSLSKSRKIDCKIKIAGEDDDNGRGMPRFLVEDNKLYLEMMLVFRRRNMSENAISNLLTQLDASAAKSAYALYELGLNKKKLLEPQTSESEKEELKDRNQKLVKMLYEQYFKKHLAIQKQCDEKLKTETDPEKIEEIKRTRQNSVDVLIVAGRQIGDFDIEKTDFELPTELLVCKSGEKKEPVKYKGRTKDGGSLSKLLKKNQGSESPSKILDSDISSLFEEQAVDMTVGESKIELKKPEDMIPLSKEEIEKRMISIKQVLRMIGTVSGVSTHLREEMEVLKKLQKEQEKQAETGRDNGQDVSSSQSDIEGEEK